MDDSRTITKIPYGTVDIPPSKSVMHRALICAGLAAGKSELKNAGMSQDVSATIACLRALGVGYEYTNGNMAIRGGLHSVGKSTLDCLDSGTTLRFLLPVAALMGDESEIKGGQRLLQRPLQPLLRVLEQHGCNIVRKSTILIVKGPILPGVYDLPGDVSSQFVSALLLALPLLESGSEIRLSTKLESEPYVSLTIDIMKRFGISISKSGMDSFHIPGGQCYKPCDITIEADYAQAAFYLVAGALGCCCECRGLGENSLQGDAKILDILRTCGVDIKKTSDGGLAASAQTLKPACIDISDIPDLAPPLAALLVFCEGQSKLYNAKRLRYKESDRLQSIAKALNSIGADIIEKDDELIINGRGALRGGTADSFDDHRIAMMLAVAGIRSEMPVTVLRSGCVNKSYPHFWPDFEKKNRGDR